MLPEGLDIAIVAKEDATVKLAFTWVKNYRKIEIFKNNILYKGKRMCKVSRWESAWYVWGITGRWVWLNQSKQGKKLLWMVKMVILNLCRGNCIEIYKPL